MDREKKSPMTRMGIAAMLREELVTVANYSKKNGTERNLRMEAMMPVMKKQLPLRAHAHRIVDIMTALRIAKEFGLRLVIEHGTDAYKVARELADAKVPVVHDPWIKVRGNLEQSGRVPESPRLLVDVPYLFWWHSLTVGSKYVNEIRIEQGLNLFPLPLNLRHLHIEAFDRDGATANELCASLRSVAIKPKKPNACVFQASDGCNIFRRESPIEHNLLR